MAAAEGAQVVITGRDKTRLDAAVDDLDGGARVLAVRSDVASLADLDALTAAIRDRYGRLDVVFANAGVASFQPSGEITEAEFDRIVDINFKRAFFTIQKSLPLLSDQAAIVINASWTLHRGLPAASLYRRRRRSGRRSCRYSDDVASTVAFFASGEASYANGQDLIIDTQPTAASGGRWT